MALARAGRLDRLGQGLDSGCGGGRVIVGRVEVKLTEDIVGEHEGRALWLGLEELDLGAGGGVMRA